MVKCASIRAGCKGAGLPFHFFAGGWRSSRVRMPVKVVCKGVDSFVDQSGASRHFLVRQRQVEMRLDIAGNTTFA